MPYRRVIQGAVLVGLLLGAGLALAWWIGAGRPPFWGSVHRWSPEERRQIRSLSLDALPPLPPDPSNAVADDPQAVALGHALFFDPRLSGDGTVACASCHRPQQYFTDGRARANVRGEDTPRHTPTIVGAGYNTWFFWDGRKDSLWSQALSPQEAPLEHAGTRSRHAQVIATHYRDAYEALFGPMPDISDPQRFPRDAGPVEDPVLRAAWEAMAPEDRDRINRIFANIGKVLAAYQRRILPGRTRFDDYASAVASGDEARMAALFTDDEAAGLRLFIGKAQCINCHNGPLLTNGEFHNIGLPPLPGEPTDLGRVRGASQVLEDEFNCLGPYSDAAPESCLELRFIKTEGVELVGAFKVPSLRNVAATAPYMHNGSLATLEAVVAHYNAAPRAFPGHSDLEPLNLTAREMAQLVAFLETLSGPPDAPADLLAPPGEP